MDQLDPNEYIEAELQKCEKEYGKKGRAVMEHMLGTRAISNVVTSILNEDTVDCLALSKSLVAFMMGATQRILYVSDLPHDDREAITHMALHVVDCIDSMDDPTHTNLH